MTITINRDALRSKLADGPVAVIHEANRLGYCRGEFENGLEVIASPDASDWIALPDYSMRQAREVMRAISLMTPVDMGR